MAETNNKTTCVEKGLFGETIKQQYDPVVKHYSHYLPDGHLSITICGSSGCGKSHLLRSLIPQMANISQVIICSLVFQNPVYRAVEQYCNEKDIEFIVLTEPVQAKATIETMISAKPEGTNGVIVFDDFTQHKSGRNDPYNQLANMTTSMLRNYGYFSVFITQNYTGFPTTVRLNSNVKIAFCMFDINAIRRLREDFLSAGVIRDKEKFDKYYHLIQQTPHSFLMLSRGGKNRLFIYLPGENDESDIQEILDFQDEIKDDPVLERYTTQIRQLKRDGSPYGKFKLIRVKEKIDEYIDHLAKSYRVEKETIESIVDELINY